jgi:hypothetical protein
LLYFALHLLLSLCSLCVLHQCPHCCCFLLLLYCSLYYPAYDV